MNNPIPCFTDSDENRFQSDPLHDATLDDDFPVKTEMEKRISWICSDWGDALVNDRHDDWYAVRMEIYGACQTLIYSPGRSEDYRAMNDLGNIAFKNGLDCLSRGKYEGAPQ